MGSDTIWNAAFVRLLFLEICLQFGLTAINPIVPLYAVALGASLLVAGLLSGLYPFCSLVFRVFGGFVPDDAGETILAVTAVAFALSALLCAVVDSLPALVFSRIAMGAIFVFKSSIVVSLAAKSVPSNCIGRGVGWIGAAGIAANAIGPSIGSWLGDLFGYRVTFFFSTALFAIAFFVSVSIRLAKGNTERTAISCWDRCKGVASRLRKVSLSEVLLVKAVPFGIFAGFVTFTFGSIFAFILMVGDERGIDGIAFFFIVFALSSLVTRPVSGCLYDRFGLKRVLIPSIVLMFAGIVIIAGAANIWSVALGGMLYALGQGGSYPTIQAECVSLAPEGRATLAANTFYFGADAGMALGPFASSIFYGGFGSFWMLLMNAGVVALFLIVYLIFASIGQKKETSQHESEE